MTIDLTQIVIALIGLATTLITTYLIPYITSKLSAEQQKKAIFWTKLAVEAAEKIYSEEGKGAEKKAYVISFLERKGIHLSEQEIDVAIEAAVLELQNSIAA